MRLESAVYTSREGLNVHGQAIGVVGDNISNVSTIGFKSSRTEFADLVSEGAEGQSYAVGGGGSGAQIAKIRTLQETGVIEFTGRSLDVAIGGRGFFMIGDAAAPAYSRAGNFSISEEGFLVDADGKTVLGSPPAAAGSTEESTTLQALNLLDVDVSGTPSSAINMVGNLDASSAITTTVANPTSFNQINQFASFRAGCTAYDSLGAPHNVSLFYFKTGNNTRTTQAYMDGGEIGGTAGQPVQIGQDTTLTFNSSGTMDEASQAAAVITAAPAYSGGAAAGSFKINMGSFTQYANGSQLSGITQDGQGTGQINNYEFKKSGELVAVLSSGARISVGTIKLADFSNLDGLQRAGNNKFVEGQGAGALDPAAPGTGALGELQGSSLERSTVDLANQFVDLTLYQRGYQANSQVLSVAASMIRDTLGLIR